MFRTSACDDDDDNDDDVCDFLTSFLSHQYQSMLISG